MLIALGNDHVAAIAAPALEIAPAGSVLLDRRHYFEQLIADGKQRIFQTKVPDARVAVTHFHAQHIDELLLNRRQFGGHQCNLSKSQPHMPSPCAPVD